MANKYLFYTNAGLIRTGENAPVSDVQFSISKNNNEVDTFYINIQDYDYTNSYATITATLPDETETPAIVMTPTDFQKDGVTYKGFKYIVKQSFTSIAGIETITFRIKSNTDDSQIFMSRLVVTIVDNDTSSDPTITDSQYDELLEAMSLAYSGEVADGTEEMPTYMLDKDNGFYKFKSGAYMNLPYLKDGVLTDRIIYNNSSKDIPIMYGLTDDGIYSLFGYFTTELVTDDPTLINMEFDNKVVFATTPKVYETEADLVFNHRYYVSGKINNSTDVGDIDIYAPTSAGTTGNVLKSTGGTPAWGTLESLTIMRSGIYSNSYNGSTSKTIDIPQIADDLVTNDNTMTLSARQGSLLRQMIVANRYGTAFDDIQDLVSLMVVAGKDEFMQWSNLYIIDTNVPDFWIVSIEDTSVSYTYTTDSALINAVKTAPVQIGYYKISLLETEKVDLSGYVEKTTKINNHTLDADVTITQSDVGLGNVDNTSDLNKPISTATQTALNGKQDEITSSNKLSASLVSGLGAVATSNNYNDLNNKPTINDKTITIQKNGTNVDTFTTNASSNKTINITDVASATTLANVIDNTQIIANSSGGFGAGSNSASYTGGVAIGSGALADHGGVAIGSGADTESSDDLGALSGLGGGAIGKNSVSLNGGGAIGHGAYASNGGFAGGWNAKAQGDYDSEDGFEPNIQLGKGTNSTPYTLQVFNDNIYNADTHTLNVANATFTNTPTINGTNVAKTSDIPTKTSDLTNDGDGTSNFATESYVQTNGGKIDTISVNNVQQSITNKNVNITVPTNNNELTNGAGYQTASDVSTAIGTATSEMLTTSNYSTTLDDVYQAKGSYASSSDLTSLSGRVTTIEGVIPSETTSSNQLADKSFVNSSISTATATYRGNYNLVSDLSLTTSATHSDIETALASEISVADNNDYCFVQIPTADATPTQIASIERYKFNGTSWDYEYELNNSGFTASQWASINSGITSTLVDKIGEKELFYCTYGTTTYAEITTALSNGKLPVCIYDNKQYVYVGLSTTNRYTFSSQLFDTQRYVSVNSSDSWGAGNNNFEITSNKVKSISNASTDTQYPSAKLVYDQLLLKQDKIDSSHKLSSDLVDDTGHTNLFVTSTEKSTWNGKQNAITSSNKLSTDLISGLSSVATSGSYSDLLNRPYAIQDISTQTITISDLDAGIYRLTYAGDKTIYYYTNKSFTIYYKDSSSIPLLFVSMGRTSSTDYSNERGWLLLESSHFHTGRTTGSVGEHNGYNLGENNRWITKGYVLNHLNHSTSDNDYVLSAYQGYLLDQNKQDKLDYTITSTDISITEVD